MQNNKNILMYVPYVVVLSHDSIMFYHVSHNSRSTVCLFAMCFYVSVQQNHQELRTIIDVWVCHDPSVKAVGVLFELSDALASDQL